MKKKIAVFANGLNSENLMKYMNGIKKTCREGFADFHVFLSHDSFGSSDDANRAEWSIYNLPNLDNYDGAIIFGPGLNFLNVTEDIADRCRKAGLPTISISNTYEGATRIFTDNYEGMKLVISHIVEEHQAKKILFIAGPKDNEESNERLRAVKDVLWKNNIDFNDNNVFYANWIAYHATDFIKKKYYSAEGLPDAIVCANDMTAFFVCLVLEDLGLKCPEDVIVTGFDGTYQSMTFYPSITTSVQPFYEMGVKTVNCFEDIFEGREVLEEYYIPCSFRVAESCGCNTSSQFDEFRRQFSIKTYRNDILNDFRLFRIKELSDAVLKSASYDTIADCLQEFFYKDDGFEGNPFYICMDPLFSKLSEYEVEDFNRFEFGKSYVMLVGKDGDKKYDKIYFNTLNELIPAAEDSLSNHIYVFLPVYYKTFVCGYIVMSDNIDYFGDCLFQFMKVQFNRLLDPYKKNMQLTVLNNKLSQLMNKDALTSTKNRMAFETYKNNINIKLKDGLIENIAVILADINDLKVINDNYGHEAGDEYIKNSSSLICNTYKHSPVFRVGGDEFLIILQGDDFLNRHELFEEIGNYMLNLAHKEVDAAKKVSIALGLADYDGAVDSSIDDTIKRADARMYENKRKFKQQSKA